MEQIGRIQIVAHVPQGDYTRLMTLAERRGFMHKRSGRPNVSGTLREVVAAGLSALETGDDRSEAKHDAEN